MGLINKDWIDSYDNHLRKFINRLFSRKQDTISDLSTIRSGASAGATAVQPAALQNRPEVFWATFGTTTYAEIRTALEDGKTIMAKRIQAGFNSKYGWLTNDTSSGVYQGNKAFIFNSHGEYKNLECWLCLEDDRWASEFYTFSSSVTGSDNQYPSGYAIKNYAEKLTDIVAPVNTTDATLPISALSCEVGKYYRIDVAVETLAVTLPLMSDNITVRTVVIYLTAGTTPAVTINSTAPSGGSAPDVLYQDGFEIESGNTYEINCLWNGLVWVVACVQINVE